MNPSDFFTRLKRLQQEAIAYEGEADALAAERDRVQAEVQHLEQRLRDEQFEQRRAVHASFETELARRRVEKARQEVDNLPAAIAAAVDARSKHTARIVAANIRIREHLQVGVRASSGSGVFARGISAPADSATSRPRRHFELWKSLPDNASFLANAESEAAALVASINEARRSMGLPSFEVPSIADVVTEAIRDGSIPP